MTFAVVAAVLIVAASVVAVRAIGAQRSTDTADASGTTAGPTTPRPDTTEAVAAPPPASERAASAPPASEAVPRVPGGEPPGTDPQAVAPSIRSLLRELDDTVGRISADPEVAAKGSGPLHRRLRRVFAPDSDFADGLVEYLRRRGARGESVRSERRATPPVQRSIEGEVTTVSADEVTFDACYLSDFTVYDRHGDPIETWVDDTQLHRGTAVRVDGRWKLRSFDALDDDEVVHC
jgi:hypothetical protein